MKKLIAFIVFVSIWVVEAENLNLVMLVGCEDLSSSQKYLHQSFIISLENKEQIPNLAILVSSAVLTGFIKECEENSTKSINSKFNLDKDWTIFKIPNITFAYPYYLFIKNENVNKFKNALKIDKFPHRKFNQIKKLSECNTASKLYSSYYFDALFEPNKALKDRINILLQGHSESPKNFEDRLSEIKRYLTNNPTHNTYTGNKIISNISNATSLKIDKIKFFLSSMHPFAQEKPYLEETFHIKVDEKNIKNVINYILKQIRLKELIHETKTHTDISGMKMDQFENFLNFLNKNINVGYLYVDSCYIGGINSLLAFSKFEDFNKLKLDSQMYNFDIVFSSSDEGVVYCPNNNFIIFKSLIEKGDLKKPFHMSNTPMIRQKNQSVWSPLRKIITGAKTFNITKTLVDAYGTKNKELSFDTFENKIFVSTPCVNIPINFSDMGAPRDRQFILRLKNVFFNTISMNTVPSFTEDTHILHQLIDLFVDVFDIKSSEERVETLLDKNIFIEKLNIYVDGKKFATFNNLYLTVRKNNESYSLILKLTKEEKLFEVNLPPNFDPRSTLLTPTPYYMDDPEIQNLLKTCKNCGTDLTQVSRHRVYRNPRSIAESSN